MNRILSLLAAGPITCLVVMGSLATIIVLLSLTGRLQGCERSLESMALRLRQQLFVSFVRGAASVGLLLLLSFGVCFRFPPLQILGMLLLVFGLALLTGGFVVASIVIGERLGELFESSTTRRFQLALGGATLASATILPVVGWATALFGVIAGTGALLYQTIARSEKVD